MKLVFNMTWLMEVLTISLEEQLPRNKAFNIVKSPKYYGYQKGSASLI